MSRVFLTLLPSLELPLLATAEPNAWDPSLMFGRYLQGFRKLLFKGSDFQPSINLILPGVSLMEGSYQPVLRLHG